MKSKTQKIITKLASVFLVLAFTVNVLGSMLQYSLAANAYSTLGTNQALGSPIINPNFSAEDWNKWEMVVWGIFLSNFATPFVDDYNSAFNLSSGYGSNGSGAKALQFGSGMDIQNNKVLQDLLDYAINQQMQGSIKQIYVSYNTMENGTITKNSSFNNSSTSTDSTEADSTTGTMDDVAGGGSTDSDIRPATVADLMVSNKVEKNKTSANLNDGNGLAFLVDKFVDTTNYIPLVGVDNAEVPTFAIKSSGGQYTKVFDYTDSYDLGVTTLMLTRGLCGDYKKEFADVFSSIINNPEDYMLVLDCFGNICTQMNGKCTIIIPASANKWLTTSPSINLVNSLVFNACTSTSTSTQLVMNAGQAENGWWSTFTGNQIKSGVAAFSNKADGVNPGQAVIYYDTDTIVMQDAIKSGWTLSNNKYTVNTGELYKKLYACDINSALSGSYTFKVEPANLTDEVFEIFGSEDSVKTACKNMILATSQLSNIFNTAPDAEVLTKLKTAKQGEELNIFGKPVVIPVQMIPSSKVGNWRPWVGGSDKDFNLAAIHRMFANYAYQSYMYTRETAAGTLRSEDVREAYEDAETPYDLYNNLVSLNNIQFTRLARSFILERSDFYKDVDSSKMINFSLAGKKGPFVLQGTESVDAFKINTDRVDTGNGNISPDRDTDLKALMARNPFARSVKAYATSDVMCSIANILGVRDGTEFAVYSMYIYLTYLDWYGISSNNGVTGASSKLNPNIYDGTSDILNVNINDIADVMTDEQKEDAVLNWTYMMLNPTDGREYRSNIIISGISDFIYNTYQKIVYGDSSSYYSTGTGVTSRNSTGFMTVAPYSENFATAWFVNNYSYFAVILVGIFTVLIIVSGLLKRRKISWFLVTMIMMINMFLVLPSTGEVVPLIANNYVQDMFQDKMSYWAISESVTNATMEADYTTGNTISNGYLNKLTKEEQAQVVKMVKNLNSLYVDRSINVKQDISKKVTMTNISTYEDVQQLRSARWMLPMIMRQFSANDGSANYVYVPLGDLYDDLSNMYWYFYPDEAAYASTITSSQTKKADGSDLPKFERTANGVENIHNRVSWFMPYVDITSDYITSESKYKQISYDIKNETDNIHTYSYFVNIGGDGIVQAKPDTYSNFDSYDEWAKDYTTKLLATNPSSKMETLERYIEQYAGSYDRFDRGTINGTFSYLWATENPFHYFYEGVKDSFVLDKSLGSVVGELMGDYVQTDDGGEVRKTFMHDERTGNIRDVLDLENMFTNMIPYIYSMQLIAEGYDDVPGVFEPNDKIENISVYKNNSKSWLFRSNWVTKLMENKDYHASSTIMLSDGTKAKVYNMMLPECYEEAGRPMIFSEAQMKAEGLTEADLSLVELKCVKVNNDVSKQWTLLINYASVPGMTKEVMMRQMALDALLIFNREFSPVGIMNNAYSMYPDGIDLRSISFDSIMKMLMLNVTHNTSYIYGDTMQTLVEDSDIFTSILLLITAFICVYIIPLVRNILMASIFFLGLWSIIWSILKSNSTKAKISCGFMLSNIVFLALTFAYFLSFRAIMAMTTTDEVLSLTQIEINTGNPVWCMLFILLISCLYIYFMYKMGCLCFANYRDMGFEMYAGIAQLAAGGISGKIEQLGARIAHGSNADIEAASKGRRRGSTKSGKASGDDYQSSSGGSGSGGGSGKSGSRKSSSTSSGKIEGGTSFFREESTDSTQTSRVAQDIDAKIARGKSQNTAKATLDVAQFTDIKCIENEIESQKRKRDWSRKDVEKWKQSAAEYNRKGVDPSPSIKYAKESRQKELEASANMAALEKRKQELINQNKQAQSHNQDIIDSI